MAYLPGSFTKNFAWHGTGLQKLHTTIRQGFRGVLTPISRDAFRSKAGVDSDIVLIPINFFLHNHDGEMSVDELVCQAIKFDHSLQFDRLALFALNLSRVSSEHDQGSGQEIVARPAMWANEFVREQLWSQDKWLASALQDESLDQFLSERMAAKDNVRSKCRTNYRHIFELCRYLPSKLSIVNSGAEQWIASALFLAWDRHILGGGGGDKSSLLELIETDELYKLLGVSQSYALSRADLVADLYVSAGRLNRFGKIGKSAAPKDSEIDPPSTDVTDGDELYWLEQDKSDGVVERRRAERSEQVRDRKKSAQLKRLYNNSCQFCGTRLQVADAGFYSEAAHIKGLGEPHNGPDVKSNMLVLCPNHHIQFDRGILGLEKAGSDYQIWSKADRDRLHGKKIELKHSLEEEYIRYHSDWFESIKN